ncbi:MAG: transcriptional repressor [Candidatus Staskawiczbacteria bacterium]|jgi:Fe2+ or Zn2+ uptake regulation protein
MINVKKSAVVSGERMTAQKSFILKYLMSVKTHPTAEIVYKEVKKKLPNISQGTVYRVLNNFKKKGEIQVIDTKDTVHFDADISNHAHFICEECGNVYDVMDECVGCSILRNRKVKVGSINSYKINFYGTCKNCK